MQSLISSHLTLCNRCFQKLSINRVSNHLPLHYSSSSITISSNSLSLKKNRKRVTSGTPKLKIKQFPSLLRELEREEKRLNAKSYQAQLSSVAEQLNESIKKEPGLEQSLRIESPIDQDYLTNNTSNYAFKLLEEQENLLLYGKVDQEDTALECAEESVEGIEDEIGMEVEENEIKKVEVDRKFKKTKRKNAIKAEEMRASLRKTDLESKSASLKKTIKSYLQACIHADMISRGHTSLLHYRNKWMNKKDGENINPIDVSVYNTLMRGWARRGKTSRVRELFILMKAANVTPDAQSFSYLLLSLSKQLKKPHANEMKKIMNEMKDNNINPYDLLTKSVINIEEKNKIEKLFQIVDPHFTLNPPVFVNAHSSELTKPLDNLEQQHFNPSEGIDLSKLDEWALEQFNIEMQGSVTVDSIAVDPLEQESEKKSYYKDAWNRLEDKWRKVLKESFIRNVKTLEHQSNSFPGMTIYPYLVVIDPSYYVDALIEEIRSYANFSEYYSPYMKQLHGQLGRKIMLKYISKTQKRDGTLQDNQVLYNEFIKYYSNPELIKKYNPREFMHKTMVENEHYFNTDDDDKQWPNHIQVGVGSFLFNLMLREVKININVLQKNSSKEKKDKNSREVPAFYISYKCIGDSRFKKELRAYSNLTRLFQSACLDKVPFTPDMLPMVSPPMPWISPLFGGYLQVNTNLIRFDEFRSKEMVDSLKTEDLYSCLDSLNALSLCPWIINKKVLDTAISIFRNNGDPSLDIPIPQSAFPDSPKIQIGMSKADKFALHKKREALKREKAEMYSLWCDCLYKLSIANKFRDRIFWFPNNFDFRGRVYPVPPHYNHLGNDLARGTLLFARGQPLGPRGLDWLKIHVVNLTGLKKKSSVAQRLEYAEEIMPEILDSADNPLDGNKWWTKSDEPWQTLACCIEIANASRSQDPSSFISHFPVHQDGSCNGLQHYAALGRDLEGAISVNLQPNEYPHDVYSDVAALVEKQRIIDAEDGNELAKSLEGIISRKVVKQTVMTFVYGVTRFGARFQINKRLKEIEPFTDGKRKSWGAASYLTQKTFQSIATMFTETRVIQDWLTDCARVISKEYGKPVQWKTPLNFPVVQPYFKAVRKTGETFIGFENTASIGFTTKADMFQKPNSVKQKNAFAPNFIHSLDSTHMMLTSLHCHKHGITFASVHDCFWTHACDVETMNKICRDQFIMLHSQPILDDLSNYFVNHYMDINMLVFGKKNMKPIQVLKRKLTKGAFNLEDIRNSTYFFS